MYARILHMKRTTIFLDEGIERDLKALAARREEPMANLVREAISQYLVGSADEVRELSFVGAGRSGRSDIAETHEELLWDDLAPHGAPSGVTAPRQRKSRAPSGRRTRGR
jgi:hypothetical protein